MASYVGLPAADLKFSYAAKGKPSLSDSGVEGGSIKFNLAHSQDAVIYAFTRGREIGVDVEFVREDLADDEIAERFFSPAEVEALRALPKEVRSKGFFNCWTRKEAYIKALGEGLSMPLNAFDVSLAPGEPAALLRSREGPNDISRWSMYALPVKPGYIAALVVEGHDVMLKTFQAEFVAFA
jgi:4'-phosphopantetheinyl transferase